MSTSIRRLGVLLLGLFVLLSLALPYWQMMRAPELLARADNPRPAEEERRIERGRILSADGQELAASRRGANGVSSRTYSYAPLAATVGYWSGRYGNGGIEAARDLDLRGDGRLTSLDALNRRLLHQPVIGDDVILSIDLRLQKVADDALGKANGAIVVLNAGTGAILALVSHPYIDPNRLEADWDKIKVDPARPLLNRATQGLYTPGSTFKTVTLAAALDTGMLSPSSTFSYTLRAPDAVHHAWWHQSQNGILCENHPTSQGQFDLTAAYAWSCNVAFSEIGLQLGPETYADYARRFGLGSAAPLEIPVATSQLFHTPNYFSGPEQRYALASTAFGQGELAVTPLQMALIAAAVANEGMIPQPYLVAELRDRQGNGTGRTVPQRWRTAMSPQTASLERAIMGASTEWGWAQTARIPGVSMGGKTGTAETGDPTKPPHSWFIGFAQGQNATNATYAIAVIKEFTGYGSEEAAPAAKKVLEAAIK
jgi:peptidoglycan glycosyltransferase